MQGAGGVRRVCARCDALTIGVRRVDTAGHVLLGLCTFVVTVGGVEVQGPFVVSGKSISCFERQLLLLRICGLLARSAQRRTCGTLLDQLVLSLQGSPVPEKGWSKETILKRKEALKTSAPPR
jgi:hypothetical protein